MFVSIKLENPLREGNFFKQVIDMNLTGRRRKQCAVRINMDWAEDGNQIRRYMIILKMRKETLKALADYNEKPYDVNLRDIT